MRPDHDRAHVGSRSWSVLTGPCHGQDAPSDHHATWPSALLSQYHPSDGHLRPRSGRHLILARGESAAYNAHSRGAQRLSSTCFIRNASEGTADETLCVRYAQSRCRVSATCKVVQARNDPMAMLCGPSQGSTSLPSRGRYCRSCRCVPASASPNATGGTSA